MGFKKSLFVSKSLAEKYLCALCQDVCKEVCETDCGHLFCHTCVSRLMCHTHTSEPNQLCPQCRSPLTWSLVHRSRFLDREIQALKVECSMCKNWRGALCDLNNHIDYNCPDSMMDCSEWKQYGCVEKIKRKDIEKHNIEFEAQHWKMKCEWMHSVHCVQINALKAKFEKEKLAIDQQWKRKLIDLHDEYMKKNTQNKEKSKKRKKSSINVEINKSNEETVSDHSHKKRVRTSLTSLLASNDLIELSMPSHSMYKSVRANHSQMSDSESESQ